MMLKTNKYIKIIVVGLVLGISAISLTTSANELNKLDIKKSNSAGSALNVTIFTENPYNENVAVSQKADNKYVILIPNISGANASNVDFSSIKDVVSDVNVKSINDGVNGYTKVTLTTTKPVSITTSAKKSTPLTEEQKAYKNLIAQSRGYETQNTSQSTNKPTGKVNPAHSEIIHTAAVIDSKPIQDMQMRPKSVIDKFKNIVGNSATQENAADIGLDNKKVIDLPPLETSYKKGTTIKTETPLVNEVKSDSISENKQKTENEIVPEAMGTSASGLTGISKPDIESYTTDKSTNKGLNNTMLTSLFILLTSLLGLTLLFKTIRNSIKHSIELRRSFKENLHEKPHSSVIDGSDIIVDNNLNWQEKYQNFVNRIEEIDPTSGAIRKVGNGEYEFVASAEDEADTIDNIFHTGYASEGANPYAHKSNLKPAKQPKLTSYNKPAMNSAPKAKPIKKVKNQNLKTSSVPRLEIVERKSEANTELDLQQIISKLEKTLNDSPSKEKQTTSSQDVIAKQFENNLTKNNNYTIPVHNEEDVIVNTLRTSPKLKSFAHKTALEKTGRKLSLPKSS